MYDNLLTSLCGYTAEEIERDRARIDKAFDVLGIGPEDISRAENRITTYFDVELSSVRRQLGVYIRRLVNLVLCKEEWGKVVYTDIGEMRLNVALNTLDGVYSEQPSCLLGIAMGYIFDKITPIIDSAEAHGMPAGKAMCSGTQMNLGAIRMGIIPPPDIALVSGYYCDQVTKPYEQIQESYGTRTIYIDGSYDSPWGQYPEIDPRRVAYLAAQLRKAIGELEDALGVEITDEVLANANRQYAKIYYGMAAYNQLLRTADPQPVSQTSLILMQATSVANYERVQLEELPQVYSTFIREIKQRIDAGMGVVPKGSPRVATYSPPMGDPAIQRMVEECGIQVALWAHMELLPLQMEKSPYPTWEERTAHSLLLSGYFYDVWAKSYRAKELAKIYDLNGMLWFYSYACRMDGYGASLGKKYLEEDINLPVLALEMESYDTRHYSVEAMRTRVETFAEMLQLRK
ncbi:MAG: 2-hydroxyacyl-CoA dehydratase [Proteobacteria bacterium]|nr:2-hydroxyacyl-CoA dehydratase [Pseudomonadota bacterium]